MTKKKQKKHKHDWQLLSYGNIGGYFSTLTETEMVVLMVCRECNKVIEQKVEKLYNNEKPKKTA